MKTLKELLEDWEREAGISEYEGNEDYSKGIWYCIIDLQELRKELRKRLENLPLPKVNWQCHEYQAKKELIEAILGH